MTGSLIIDARHRLRWHRRLLSDASTALLWSGWMWMWVPFLRTCGFLGSAGGQAGRAALPKLVALGQEGALGSVVALVGASGTLLVWNRVVAPRARTAPPVALRDHAPHLPLSEGELRAGREAAVCVVHHDEHGRIVRLEPRRGACAGHRAA